eukprot:TRINITY_DN4370_c0_g1_i3.p2 TRINITY_DN4370_c0_g1~~TRINITY_DN4370_c0_g1_i3.p2  ORF type:complete len:150 (-),score=52.92 TRINITY_DN4370_c0_g1_i3:188-637(-)
MVPLEVSHTLLVTPAIETRISNLGTPYSEFLKSLLTFFRGTYSTVFGFEHPPLHDPLAVGYVIDPTMFKTRLMNVQVETSGSLTSGRTVCDLYGMSKGVKNVNVALSVNVDAFWNVLMDAISVANSKSPINTFTPQPPITPSPFGEAIF